MADFTLSRMREKVLPEYVMDCGRKVKVDADFRTVLKCLRILGDESIHPMEKYDMLRAWFFLGVHVSRPIGLFFSLVSGSEPSESDERLMDFERDADAIYASFFQQYGLDLMDVGFLHWAKFQALVSGLGENTALGRRIAIRSMDTRKMDAKNRAKMERLKRKYALDACPMSGEEARLQKALDDALTEGRDPAAEVRALTEYYERQEGDTHGE